MGGGIGTEVEYKNPVLNLHRYVEHDVYGGIVHLNDNPASVDSNAKEYSLGVFSNAFESGSNAATSSWPITLSNSQNLFQLVGSIASIPTAFKPLGTYVAASGDYGVGSVGYDKDADGVMDNSFGAYAFNMASLYDMNHVSSIPNVNLLYDPANSVVRQTYAKAFPEFLQGGSNNYFVLSERLAKRNVYHKYGAYLGTDDDYPNRNVIVDARKERFTTGVSNGLYVDSEGKIKTIGANYFIGREPQIWGIFGLFDKFFFNEYGRSPSGIYDRIFTPEFTGQGFIEERYSWDPNDEESNYIGTNHRDRITKYLQDPYANVGHLLRLFMNSKFRLAAENNFPDEDFSGPQWDHLRDVMDFYDDNLQIECVSAALGEVMILLDSNGKIHVIAGSNPEVAANAISEQSSYATQRSFINHLMIFYPEEYRRADWGEYLDPFTGVPLDQDNFPYMSSEKYFWVDDSG